MQNNILIIAHFIYKISIILAATFSIYLGYKLFILGVTGETHFLVENDGFKSQLINASPGIFSSLGGIITLIALGWRGSPISVKDKDFSMRMNNGGNCNYNISRNTPTINSSATK